MNTGDKNLINLEIAPFQLGSTMKSHEGCRKVKRKQGCLTSPLVLAVVISVAFENYSATVLKEDNKDSRNWQAK